MSESEAAVGTVYLARNIINGHGYVGQTWDWPDRRLGHEMYARLKPKFLFDKKIRQYGPENFRWSILYQGSVLSQVHLDLIEDFWIIQLRTLTSLGEGGYNVRRGGSRGRHAPETILKMTGQRRTPETREKLRVLRLGRNTGGMAGKKHSQKTIEKMRVSAIKRCYSTMR